LHIFFLGLQGATTSSISSKTNRLETANFCPTLSARVTIRAARWFIFRPKIAIWVHFGGSCNGRCWCILWTFVIPILRPFDLFYGHLVYFVAICYIFPRFRIYCTKKNLATLVTIKSLT
jgi:hypothetical protein